MTAGDQFLVVASLNMLGDACNAFEFLESLPASSGGNGDSSQGVSLGDRPSSLHDARARVLASFETLTAEEVVREACALGLTAGPAVPLRAGPFHESLDAAFLARDSALSLLLRTNLIVCGMKPVQATNGDREDLVRHPDGDSCGAGGGERGEREGERGGGGGGVVPLFRRAGEWREVMRAQVGDYLASGKDGGTALWDVACNLAGERALESLILVSEASSLNPELLEGHAATLLAPLFEEDPRDPLLDMAPTDRPAGTEINESTLSTAGGGGTRPVLLAVQECAPEGTAKRAALEKAAASRYLRILPAGNGLAFLHSPSLQVSLLKVGGVEARLSEADRAVLQTTIRRTAVVAVGEDLVVANVHAKEPTSVFAAEALARYFQLVCSEGAHNLCRPGATLLLLSDTNLPSRELAEAFAAECGRLSMTLLPSLGTPTTRKMRSTLHGQRANKAKTLTLVEAHKDFAVLPGTPNDAAGGWVGGWTAERARVYPDLAAQADLLLPHATWASDHSMVQVFLKREAQV